jgi:hypothetical protein
MLLFFFAGASEGLRRLACGHAENAVIGNEIEAVAEPAVALA